MGDKNKTLPELPENIDGDLCSAIGELSNNITHLSNMVSQLQRTLEQNKAKTMKTASTSSCTVH